MDVELPKLHATIQEKGHDESVANHVIELIKPFIGYGFNRSHAAAYAFIAYQCAYLKHHYPIEFYTALLTVFAENEEKAAHYIADVRAHGLNVIPPDINRAERGFAITPSGEISYGFESMRGLRATAIDAILEKRPFESLEELIGTMAKRELDKSSIKALALSGGLDKLCPEESRIEILARAMALRGEKDNYLEDIVAFSNRKKLEHEKHYLGAYLSGHPLDGIARPIDWEEAASDGKSVVGLSIVNGIRKIITKKGDEMAFVTLTFLEQEVDAVCFPTVWSSDMVFRKGDPLVALSDVLTENMIVKAKGRYEIDESRKSFLLDNITLPVRLNKDFEDHIEKVQNDYGIVVPTQEAQRIEAPSSNWNDLLNF